ncbi:MAG: hypothetical protein ACREOF_09170 [Gemmatimonadales bacterium]
MCGTPKVNCPGHCRKLGLGIHLLGAVFLPAGGCSEGRTIDLNVISAANATLPVEGAPGTRIPEGQGDHLRLEGGLEHEASIAILDAMAESERGSECRNDAVLVGAGQISIDFNALPPLDNPDCPASTLVFSRGGGPLWVGDPSRLAWTTASGDEVALTLPASSIPLAIRFWISLDPAANVPIDAKTLEEDIRVADSLQLTTILRDNRAGIEPRGTAPDGSFEIRSVDEIDSTPGDIDQLQRLISGFCASAAQLRRTPAVYDANALNVYYVSILLDPQGTRRSGYFCVVEGGPNILFVDGGLKQPHTLAHEVGHALGLLEPSWGHAHLIDGMPATEANLMSYGVSTPTRLTLGQVVRLSMSPLSWLNREGAGPSKASIRAKWLAQAGSAVTPPLPCPCAPGPPPGDASGLLSPLPCPRVTLDVDHQPPENLPAAVCRAKVTPQELKLKCGRSKTLTATYFDETNSVALGSRGESFWEVDDVTTVDTSDANSTVKAGKLRVRGLRKGKTVIRLVAGGPSATADVQVTVTGACP